ncbi:MAG TPA: hypothetical protein P5307_07580 [Pirellulaceae bacterium]|nr:hypothetical protein [Planctomycetales bacterium]HRX78907.1 hypothetical protein [Pirellulaceae bacterium]
MKKIFRSLVLVAVVSMGVLLGCGGADEVAPAKVSQAVYVDTKTQKAMVCDVSAETPVVNPATGQRTLMPALYCPKCLRWHALPPLEQINRIPNATKCSRTGATLTADGPWPE